MDKKKSIKEIIKSNSSIVRKVQYILIALFLVLIGLDIYLALDNVKENTISQVIQNSPRNYFYILMYLWGAIAANLFLYSAKSSIFSGTTGFLIVLLMGALLEIFDLKTRFGLHNDHQNDILIYVIFMSLGILIGWLFWRQKP